MPTLAVAQTGIAGPPYTYRFMGHLKWGRPHRQPSAEDLGLPPEFLTCRDSWLKMAVRRKWQRKELAKIYPVVANQLECQFVPDNLRDRFATLLVDECFSCPVLEVTAVDFLEGPIPTICAKTFFELPFSVEIPNRDALVAWQETNDFLDRAVTFSYIFSLNEDEEVVADGLNRGINVYGPLAPDDPGRTYEEEVVGVVKRALKKS